MADPVDLVRAWQDALQQLRTVAAANLDASTLSKLIAPLQRQAEVFEQALRRQAQAQAFGAAAFSFKQAAEALEAQAAVIERAVSAMTLPADLLKSVGGPADSEAAAKKPGAKKPTRRR